MEIGYGILEEALAKAFDVPEGRGSAFASRLKYFGRLGFPAAAKVGRGTRARYGLLDVVQLAIAIELTNLGVPPVPMVHRIGAQQRLIGEALARVIGARRRKEPPSIWMFGVDALTGTPGFADDAVPLLTEVGIGELVSWTKPTSREDRRTPRAMLLIDPERLLEAIDEGFGRLEDGLSQMFREALGEIVGDRHAIRP